MALKRILIADADPKVCDEVRLALGEGWTVVGASNSSAALAETEKQPFDVVVANFGLTELNGAEFLNQIYTLHPRSIRLIAAAEDAREKAMSIMQGSHQFLALPIDRATLKRTIERSLALDFGLNNEMRELVSRIRTFPAIPSLYLEVVRALESSSATSQDIGEIIAKDMAMTTRLLQVLNSAFYGLSHKVTDPTEAVGFLGFETVKSLVMAVKLLTQYDKVKPVYFSMDQIWRHSTNVAQRARIMALLETGDTDCCSTAYMAGLMHDMGKVILAANFDQRYQRIYNYARENQKPLWEVEKQVFGATHGEIGAYLMGLWGLSDDVIKVAALHHDPRRAGDKTFTPLTAVHAANALEYEENPRLADGMIMPELDATYIEELGLTERIELWRNARSDASQAKALSFAPRAKPAARPAVQPATPAPVAAPVEKVEKFEPARALPALSVSRGIWKWLGLGLGVCAAVVFLAHWQSIRTENMAQISEDLPAVEITAPPLKEEMALVAKRAPVVQPPKIVPVPVAPPAIVAAPAPIPAPDPAAKVFDAVKLEAIFFNAQHPSALINGLLTRVDEEVADCRVLDITPSSVTLGFQNQRKTFRLQ